MPRLQSILVSKELIASCSEDELFEIIKKIEKNQKVEGVRSTLESQRLFIFRESEKFKFQGSFANHILATMKEEFTEIPLRQLQSHTRKINQERHDSKKQISI